MEEKRNLYWGETHHNTHQQARQDPALETILESARGHLDFYAAAYYMAGQHRAPLTVSVNDMDLGMEKGHPAEQLARAVKSWQGVQFEKEKSPEQLKSEWAQVEAATAEANDPHHFVTFPGYEWQGDCRWGDHNVFYREEGQPIFNTPTLPELYRALRGRNALAIPHHTAYLPGYRAPRCWEYYDEALSPFVEIYSIHGCSEYDGHPEGLRHNGHMGPGVGGATYEDLLNRGAHAGAIGGTDNWTDSPGRWGHGLMGCWAPELTRAGLWEAFRNRHVYGVTGDRIELMVEGNGRPMGSILPHADARQIKIRGKACDTVERIEILRDNRVVHIEVPGGRPGDPLKKTRYLFRMEMGWGPNPGEFPAPTKIWKGDLHLEGGKWLGWKPCWINTDQQPPVLGKNQIEFRFRSHQTDTSENFQGGYLFEFEGTPESMLRLRLNGREDRFSVSELLQSSKLIPYEQEIAEIIQTMTGKPRNFFPRSNTPFIYAYKTRLHRLIPEWDYTFDLEWEDSEPRTGEVHYRVRIIQRNGQVAWSSPLWYEASGAIPNLSQ